MAAPERSKTGKLHLVTTTSMLADAAEIIGDGRIEVEYLMGPGLNPHSYQASAGDVIKMQDADIVLYHGLHLEGKMGEVFSSLKKIDKQVICIENGIDRSLLLASEDNSTVYDPHIWFDVSIWKQACRYIAEQLEAADPENQAVYQNNYTAYAKELDALEAYINGRVQELKPEQRILITAHDAFRYFGNAYSFQVQGLQGISTDAEAGTSDMSRLAGLIAGKQIKAVFVESSVPPKTIEALQAAVKAKGFAVEIGGELYSDSLGDASSGADSYILTVKANVDTMIDALL